jgi:hypothetical protein
MVSIGGVFFCTAYGELDGLIIDFGGIKRSEKKQNQIFSIYYCRKEEIKKGCRGNDTPHLFGQFYLLRFWKH